LGLDPHRATWVLYSSSLDESTEIDTSGEPFTTQYDWVDATIDFVAQRPALQLVIRIHPNAGSRKSLGKNAQDLSYFESLAARLPPNVRLVPSDSTLSSYDLAMASSLALIWRSTIGLEVAAMGVPVICVGAGPAAYAEFIPSPSTPADYLAALADQARVQGRASLAQTVQAWRFAHAFFFRLSLSFPLVRQPKWYAGELAYDGLDALAPGKDETLDHVCGVFMRGGALYGPAPHRPASLARAESEEIAARIAPYRHETSARP
jgi:hypothetical protein